MGEADGKSDANSAPVEQQIRILTFNRSQNLESTVYRLNIGFIIQFRPGPTLFGKRLNVFTNHPQSPKDTFDRLKYRRLPWKSDSTNKGDDTALYVEVPIVLAGSFHFYVTFDDCSDRASSTASGYFLVDPILQVGGSILPLDCVQCVTYMSKCIGTLDQWLDSLAVAKEAGYNMIHFTPIQELGGSRSGYSIRNQLKLNSEFSDGKKKYSLTDVKKIVDKMNKEWKVMSVTDIVLNHTANESEWIKEHPECGYNIKNSPHLRPAYLIDRAIYHFSVEVMEGKWQSRGIPAAITTNEHVEAMARVLYDVFSKPRVEEFYMVDVDQTVEAFRKAIEKLPPTKGKPTNLEELSIIQDPNFCRKSSSVNLELAAIHFNEPESDCSQLERIERSCRNFRGFIEGLNEKKKNEIQGHLRKAVGCILGTVRYERLQDDGPKLPCVTKKAMISPPYFTHHGKDLTLEEEEKLSLGPDGCYLMAHNGWVMGDDPLRNFAEPGSNVYLRRELVAWGDSIKLRYGEKPADCPFLWSHMQKYVEETARVFSGIRLDNCHSTPIHVAEYLLDCARKVRPNLYVFAELFTSSEHTDNIFVNRLGINSLVREAMAAPDSHEEGRLVYRYGGEPVGAFRLPPVRPLVPSVAHAIFFEITHDNKSPCETRTAWDMLPSSAIVSMASCATGSNRGYDEIVPVHIHVVKEERKYTKWSSGEKPEKGFVNLDSGIIRCKRLINNLHCYLGANGYNQVFVDQVTEHIVTITRHNPVTHKSVVLVAYTSFRPPAHINDGYIRPLKVQGKFEEIIFEFKLHSKDQRDYEKKIPGAYKAEPNFINGVDNFIIDIKESLQPSQSSLVRQISPPGAETTEFEYTQNFRPGSVIAFRLSLLPHAQEAVNKTRSILGDFTHLNRISQVETRNQQLAAILNNLTLADLNRVLYRCDQEERDEGKGWGAYNVPVTGPFVYCGLQGLESELSKIRVKNDLGHPLCGNLRDGDWLMDYIVGRLKLHPGTEAFATWLKDIFSVVKDIPRYLIPSYFDRVVASTYLVLLNHSWKLLGRFVSNGSDFAKALGVCSVQFSGVVMSALLPTLSPKLEPPRPSSCKDPHGRTMQTSVTLSAGLPHFSVGYMRNWGRDTFIALPGNLLITERFEEARWIILAFAQTLRHGLIPNLLDGGPKARFNCRDAVWFWLYSIQQYVKMAPNGHKIFKDKVSRLFPKDDSPPLQPGSHDQLLECVIHEALQRHFQGVAFRERNAGFQIDSQMTDKGFNNEIGVDLDTGFPFGGNIHNCGTWMDKMGSSEKAGNKGKPATPRDGSPVEIVGLCKAALRFLNEMHKEGKFPYNSVERTDDSGNSIQWTYSFWEETIKANFEKSFWISETPCPEKEKRPDLVNRRGIYKDTANASQDWGDYQLRCNFPIALAVAPELVSPKNASVALDTAEKVLLGPLGIKTLDPSDWVYRGNYDNANDSSDFLLANGFNYHQGPEWVWPVGFLLRAKLAIAAKFGEASLGEAICHIKSLLANHFTHLLSSPWRSLPELTNANGAFCPGSNPAQAWSTGCLLEVLYEMNKFESSLGAPK